MDEQSRERHEVGGKSKRRGSTWRRLVELQLIRVRKEAHAARLDAEAAKLELLLRQKEIRAKQSDPRTSDSSHDTSHSNRPSSQSSARQATVAVENQSAGHRGPRKIKKAAASTSSLRLRTPKATSSRASCSDDAPAATPCSRRSKKRSPVALSLAAHTIGVALLALVTLKTRTAMDQVVLTATPTSSPNEPMESIAIETVEVAGDPSEPVESDVSEELELGPASADVATLAPNAPAIERAEMLQQLTQSGDQSQSLLSDQSNAAATVFCGVEGGGKHFVYLVDSSKSMGEAFSSARIELLRSIDALSKDQRFYVIFFDESPAFMRLSNPTEDESNSVLASPENKRLLRQWAMGVRMDPGKAPYDPLKFALNLAPDAIFLLSDGEFPAGIEQLLDQGNRVNNLFGEQRVRSIVHTIGYHSLQGEARMRRIAAQNEGQYRHVRRSQGVSRDGAAANRLRH